MRRFDLLDCLRRKAVIAAAVAVVSAGAAGLAGPAAAEGQLNIYNWGDYINPDVLTRFTEDTGIEVTLDTYGRGDRIRHRLSFSARARHHAETGAAA